ncbi:anhydro-N-acetylmuramic acid kinase [Calidithermus roseus]|uniref:Anhydro-N-acetylmuramic acid kinase n=1 Tax=Calidithermus roseus TaxID=1644118 RepID=A0A399EMN4_9DEIN|nr:anhydro-N-acetylmuramic acid kinase [Calidithermus roseus]RIH85974.1 Anhydro-N-acetylmuramic acid kinase [Calidithermus roseus]
MKVLGLMSGTSVDGVDLVLAELDGRPPHLEWKVLEHREALFPAELRERLLKALHGESLTRELALLHHDLGRFYAEAATSFAGVAQLAAVHGQTVWHEPPQTTLQIGEAAYLAEALGVPVAADFRPSDLALGGEAAPLVPYPDLLLYGEAGVRRAIHNIGGISNLTYLSGLEPSSLLAFDTGPGNCLIDEAASWVGLTHDPGGKVAQKGQVNEEKLSAWLAHPYFRRPPPKSTGREIWRLDQLETEGFNPPDLLATLTELTARSIAQAYERFVLPRGLDEIWVAGGGAYNHTLMQRLRALLPVPVHTFEERGHNSKVREALAFAVLGYLRFLGLPNVLPQVTGARSAAVAGKLLVPGVRYGG